MQTIKVAFLVGNVSNFDATPIKIFDTISLIRKELSNPLLIGFLKIGAYFDSKKKQEIQKIFRQLDIRIFYIPRIPILSALIAGVILLMNKITIIHAVNYTAVVNAIIIRIVFRINYIYDYHGAIPEEMVYQGIWRPNGVKYRLSKCVEKKAFYSANSIITISNRSKKYIDSLIGDSNKTRVIPCGIKRDIFYYDENIRNECRKTLKIEDKFVIIYNGSISPWNDYSKMMNLIKILMRSDQTVVLIFLTPDPLVVVQKLMHDYSICESRTIVLNVLHQQVGKYLQSADLGLLIRKDSFVNEIASPMKFSEYIACGVPVLISNNVGDSTSIVNKNEVGFIYNDSYNNHKYLEMIENIKKNRKQFADKCTKCAKELYDLDKQRKIYLELYNSK